MRKILSLLWPLLVLASCTLPNQQEMDRLAQHQKRWEARHITHYRYTLQILCFCVPEIRQPVVIEVRNGLTVSITAVESGAAVDLEHFKRLDTIEELFELIEAAIIGKAAQVDVTYDPTFGYPRRISIDHLKDAIDDEVEYRVTDFTVLGKEKE
ncbi:MAG: DUF6174 domain-containing protein [Candidatus Bipolaricaulota bacterium]|nr:DUF6174 domain-containing protein [Candidatus Bipolaricaulota bacterium]